MMTAEQERWAEALAVTDTHGDDLGVLFAERLITLTTAGDMAGVARWREIIHRCEMLNQGTIQ